MSRFILSVIAASTLSGLAVSQTQTAQMGPQTGTFSGATRGYWFTAPTSFTITGIQVLLQTGSTNSLQNFEVVHFTGNVPPPVFSTVTNAFTQLALGFDLPQNVFQPVNIPIAAGDVIGIYGNTVPSTGATTGANSYAGNVQQTTMIGGQSVDLNRSGMQFHLGAVSSPTGMHDVWQEPSSFNITRIEFTYTTGPSSPVVFCTAGTSTNGCVPSISADHQPSVSQANPCNIAVANVEGLKTGLFFYGISTAPFTPVQWGTGSSSFLCVKAPTQRTGSQSSGGAVGTCTGALALDWNAFQLANPSALGNPWSAGSKVFVQGWYRDPQAVKTTNLSNAVELTYVP